LSHESSPLERLDQTLTEAQANRETREGTLRSVPRWRFRRRKEVERSLRRREEWQQTVREAASAKRDS